MQIQLTKCLPVIVATGVLHNILIKAKEEVPQDDPDLELPAPWEEVLQEGRIREQRNNVENDIRDINPARRRLINNYYKSLHLSASQTTNN